MRLGDRLRPPTPCRGRWRARAKTRIVKARRPRRGITRLRSREHLRCRRTRLWRRGSRSSRHIRSCRRALIDHALAQLLQLSIHLTQALFVALPCAIAAGAGCLSTRLLRLMARRRAWRPWRRRRGTLVDGEAHSLRPPRRSRSPRAAGTRFEDSKPRLCGGLGGSSRLLPGLEELEVLGRRAGAGRRLDILVGLPRRALRRVVRCQVEHCRKSTHVVRRRRGDRHHCGGMERLRMRLGRRRWPRRAPGIGADLVGSRAVHRLRGRCRRGRHLRCRQG